MIKDPIFEMEEVYNFIDEDFTDEQKMMKEAVTEFIDREIWPYKDRFEKNVEIVFINPKQNIKIDDKIFQIKINPSFDIIYN